VSRLYNRYIPGAWPCAEPFAAPQETASCSAGAPSFSEITEPAQPTQKAGSILKGLLGGSIRLPEFNTDTILLLILVYFLVADDSENISDTLLIIGVLLLLGF